MGVIYEEFKPETYQGITIKKDIFSEIFKVNTGNFEFDYKLANNFITEYKKKNPEIEVFNSSTLNNFIADKQEKH